jgi:hypothetical protein
MTDICKGENYKYTLVIEGKEYVLEFYAIARLLGFRGGPLEQWLKKIIRCGETHKLNDQDLKESYDCLKIAISNPEYLKRGEKRFVLSANEDNKCYDKDTNCYDIPEGATEFEERKHGGFSFYKCVDEKVYDWLDGEDVPFWDEVPEMSLKDVLDKMSNDTIRHISEFPHKEEKIYTFPVVDATKTLKPKEFSETEPTKEEVKEGFININGHMVPEPEREPLLGAEPYHVPSLSDYEDNYIDSTTWSSDEYDFTMLERGLIHTTKEAAQLHAKALLSFTKQDNKS